MAVGDTVNGAHNDNVNQVYSIIGVQGTLGTADIRGTAETLPIGVDKTYGAMYVEPIGGSIVVTTGTINAGTIKAGTINAGTINAGTIGKVTAVWASTVNVSTVNAGTINSATINTGTIKNDGRVARNILSYSTTVTLAGTAYGTIIGSAVVGAGTSIWVNEISLINSGVGTSTFGMSFGTWMSGSAVFVRGKLVPGGGIQKSFPMPVNCGMTNYDLNVFTADAAGTVDVSISYFISA